QSLTPSPSYVRDRHAAITSTTPRDAPESARNERLRNALLDVMVATAAFNLQSAWYAKLLNDYANGHITVDAAQAQDIEQLRPASAEAFRTVQIALFICDNEEIKRIVDDIGKQITRAVGVVVSSHRRTPAGFRQGSR
ncbi:hypothetical protein, partial [Mycobacterium avium]